MARALEATMGVKASRDLVILLKTCKEHLNVVIGEILDRVIFS